MNKNKFTMWLGSELYRIFQTRADSDHFEECQGLIDKAAGRLRSVSVLEKHRILEEISLSHNSGKIGNYQIPYDERDEFDMIDALLATIQGILEER